MPNSKIPETASEAVGGLDLSARVFLVTGAYAGLGAATTRALLQGGATVIVAGRSATSQAAFARALIEEGFDTARLEAEHTLDLGNLASVRDFAGKVASRHPTIDCLINNAGVMNTPPGETADGFELQFGTNVMGHFLLAKLLATRTKRQVWLSSAGHSLTGDPPGDVHHLDRAPRINLDIVKQVDEANYDSWHRYQQSKLGDILLAKQFPREFEGLEACSVHPGVVRTNLSRHMSKWTMLKYVWAAITGKGPAMLTPERGARTQTWCAVMPTESLSTGAYYADAAVAEEADAAKNMQDAKALYDYCDEATRPFQELGDAPAASGAGRRGGTDRKAGVALAVAAMVLGVGCGEPFDEADDRPITCPFLAMMPPDESSGAAFAEGAAANGMDRGMADFVTFDVVNKQKGLGAALGGEAPDMHQLDAVPGVSHEDKFAARLPELREMADDMAVNGRITIQNMVELKQWVAEEVGVDEIIESSRIENALAFVRAGGDLEDETVEVEELFLLLSGQFPTVDAVVDLDKMGRARELADWGDGRT